MAGGIGRLALIGLGGTIPWVAADFKPVGGQGTLHAMEALRKSFA